MEWILLFVIVGILAAFISNRPKKNSPSSILKKNQDSLYDHINQLSVENKKEYIARDFSGGIIYDQDKEEIHLVLPKFRNENKLYSFEVASYSSKELVESEVVINQNSINKVNKVQLLGSAAVGGALFGGFGSIVGALTADKSNIEQVKEINMKIKTEDINNPVHTVNFLRNEDLYTMDTIKQGFHRDSSEVRAALNNVEKWQGIMEAIIRKQNKTNLA
jgi:hypothetical protein